MMIDINSLDSLLFKVYKENFRFHFQYHPQVDVIMSKLESGDYTFADVDKWFDKNEDYLAEYFTRIRADANKDGTVTFHMYREPM